MKHGRAALACAAGLALAVAALVAQADTPDAGAAPDPSASALAEPLAPTCLEHVPEGVARPKLVEHFPVEGKSGYAVPLKLEISHGKGEKVLVDGIKVATQGDAAKGIAASGFAIPDADGGAGPSLSVEAQGGAARTTLVIPVVPLAPQAGPNAMVLPPLPVTIARANGELVTLCTKPHPIRVDEPIAGEAEPKVRPNAPPRPQREEWVFLEQLLVGIAIGLVVAAIVALFLRWWRRRPRVVAPKARPVPWLVALEELDAIRRSALLAEHRNDEYFDRVSDTVRRYLGSRYHLDELEAGWSGIETTTDEMKGLLRRVTPAIPVFGVISNFLGEADLVKFARVFPADGDCRAALERAEEIVRGTIPAGWTAGQPAQEAAA